MKKNPIATIPSRVHMIGIGGIGLSAIARVLAARGIRVTGCDLNESAVTRGLQEAGIAVFVGHSSDHLHHADLVVVSSAVPGTNPEIAAAREMGIPVLHRRELLALMMRGADGIAVAGTHGKTTTTAMIAYVLSELGHDPTYIVGGLSEDLGGNARAGDGRWFVLEADEYDHAFEDLRPRVAIVGNIEMDHPDCFADLPSLRAAFGAFLQNVPSDGYIIAGADSPQVHSLLASTELPATIVTFGMVANATCRVGRVETTPGDGVSFTWQSKDHGQVEVSLRLPGLCNARNASAAMAALACCGIDPRDAAEVLGRFRGVARRFQVKGEWRGVTIVDDYAHHPSEIKMALAAARARYPGRRIVAAFQPHTYSRTEALWDEFVTCFDDADLVRLVDVFPARPTERPTVTSEDLAAAVKHADVAYVGDLSQATYQLRAELLDGDVLITLGAGAGYKIGESLLSGEEASG